jgi:hypothetical protein
MKREITVNPSTYLAGKKVFKKSHWNKSKTSSPHRTMAPFTSTQKTIKLKLMSALPSFIILSKKELTNKLKTTIGTYLLKNLGRIKRGIYFELTHKSWTFLLGYRFNGSNG